MFPTCLLMNLSREHPRLVKPDVSDLPVHEPISGTPEMGEAGCFRLAGSGPFLGNTGDRGERGFPASLLRHLSANGPPPWDLQPPAPPGALLRRPDDPTAATCAA